jgi:hypothetical protein
VDDFVVLDKDKARLHEVKAEMETHLAQFRLKLHPHKCQIFPVKDGTDFLGIKFFQHIVEFVHLLSGVPDDGCTGCEKITSVAKFRGWMSIIPCKVGSGMSNMRIPMDSAAVSSLKLFFRSHDIFLRAWCFSSLSRREAPEVSNRSSRVLRGGSWNNTAQNVRVANRNNNTPTNTNNNNGFRCAKTLWKVNCGTASRLPNCQSWYASDVGESYQVCIDEESTA